MLLVDTNVLIDVLEDDPEWADWSIAQLRAQSKVHPLTINPIIYAELSLAFSKVEALDKAIENLGLTVLELPRPTLFLAGKAFAQYRRQSQQRTGRLFHRCACRRTRLSVADARCAAISELFSQH